MMLTTLTPDRLRLGYNSGFWRDETLYALAASWAARTPDAIAMRDRQRAIGWAALVAAADALAADWRAAGLRSGQRVAVWLPSRIETLVALLACSRDGLVCCPSLHRDHTVGEVAELLGRMRAAALVAEEGYGADAARHDILARAAAMPAMRRIHALPPLPAGRLDAWAGPALATAAAAPPRAEPDGVRYLAFTSGTTAAPKGVMHSDNTVLANARAILADWSLGAADVIATLSPLSHNLGFGCMVMAVEAGCTLVLPDLARGASLLDRLMDTGTTFLVGVPTHAIDLLAELKRRNATRIGALRGFRISGAAAPPQVVADLLAHGVTPQSGYGMTEACSTHYTLPADDPALITGSSGRPAPGYEIRIVSRDDPDQVLPAGETGQIAGRGTSLMLGYFDDQAATEDSFNRDGWFLTGDLGWMDEAGYIRITGRKKDVIIRGGHNIFPAKIETLAMQHPAIARAAALPVPDARLGEKVCLAFQRRPGQEVAGQALLAHLDAAGLSRYDMPEYLLDVAEIPLTASGKILKRAVAAEVEAGRLVPTPIRWAATP
ncbi:class I adenylate-forming enzyme family protein [Falsiroseomonas selenitidurans]|uniref:Acyl--CoA ligase n=1 Tax=Falsiroseomonas selenitidurans TaxID=2716335 RepID=A0ABX1E2S5_9PROT|nr:class I adenylate-forming enzyme family protein [Falsiroseomonas selenitidurans]NKC31391.1 acyl--CoA ligase [Falsiroseomonas selenitidurans]